MANQWLRLWHDMPNDPKWRTIARTSKQSIGNVLAVYVHLLVNASNATERGRTQSVCSEDIASALDVEADQVDAILAAMQGRVLEGDVIAGWSRRQPEREDGAAERARAWREAQKTGKPTKSNAPRTQANDGERNQTPDKDKEEIRKDQKTLDGFECESTDAAGVRPAAAPARRPADYPDDFEIAWAAYPKRPGMNKKDSYKAFAARVKSGHDPTLILAGVQRYAKFCTGTGKDNTEFIKQPATFFGPNEHFLETWAFVPQPSKGSQGSKNGSLTTQNYRAGVAPNGAF